MELLKLQPFISKSKPCPSSKLQFLCPILFSVVFGRVSAWMDQRPSSTGRMSVNEKRFIEQALLSDLRTDGRRLFDYRHLSIKFGRNDGSAEVQLGETHVMGFVTAELVQPYKDRPNEGSLSIFTEFSPMADPSFEPGRTGEFAVELGRVIDRGLRESWAVDTESLCVVSGKSVWALRVDLQILDNGGNLIDAANIAALAALSTFRRPDCTLGGDNGQEVIVHSPDVKEPLPLIVHHLPIAVSFAIFNEGNIVAIDPTHKEEAVTGGKITLTVNASGDVCAIQKAGGEGISQSTVMHCLRIAALKAADMTSKIRSSVEAYNTERALRKVKRHTTMAAVDVGKPDVKLWKPIALEEDDGEFNMDVDTGEISNNEIYNNRPKINVLENGFQQEPGVSAKKFIGGPSNWDPYSRGINPDFFKIAITTTGSAMLLREEESTTEISSFNDPILDETSISKTSASEYPVDKPSKIPETGVQKTLKDAVKQKNRKKKNRS